jgi:D-alanine-D-alanine ligase
MEANLVPGMTYGSSYFPEACNLAHEISYHKVIELLLAGGLARASSTIPAEMHTGTHDKLVTEVETIY